MSREKRNREAVFATLCLFFGLLRTRVIEQAGMDSLEYYRHLGRYSGFGWISHNELSFGTPCFVGPGHLVLSLVSPLTPISDVVHAAVMVKEDHWNHLFTRLLL
jgi:hypothetical protein